MTFRPNDPVTLAASRRGTAASSATAARQRVPERVVQQQIVKLLRSMGAAVYVLGTTRRRGDHPGTMQTAGVPDLLVFVKRDGGRQFAMIECKAEGGQLRPEQAELRDLCRIAGVAHIVGGLDDVIAWLVANGYLRSEQVGHWHSADGTRRA